MAILVKCPNCNYDGDGKHVMKGSMGVEFILWLLLIVPGFIYSVWRLSNQVWVCPKCDFDKVVKTGATKDIVWATARQSLLFWIITVFGGLFLLALVLPG